MPQPPANTPLRPEIPEPTLRRLPWYLAYVKMLAAEGVSHVSSTQIAAELNVAPSQTAKDLSVLALRGKTRIGYEVALLERELQDFLGFQRQHNAVMVGVGSLGEALIRDNGLKHYGLNIVAGFDINPAIVGSEICGVPVYHVDTMEEHRRLLKAEIGIVAVPVEQAQAVADSMVAAGIMAVWNFTPYRIRVPEHIVVQNTSIYSHLAVMYNRLLEKPSQQ